MVSKRNYSSFSALTISEGVLSGYHCGENNADVGESSIPHLGDSNRRFVEVIRKGFLSMIIIPKRPVLHVQSYL